MDKVRTHFAFLRNSSRKRFTKKLFLMPDCRLRDLDYDELRSRLLLTMNLRGKGRKLQKPKKIFSLLPFELSFSLSFSRRDGMINDNDWEHIVKLEFIATFFSLKFCFHRCLLAHRGVNHYKNEESRKGNSIMNSCAAFKLCSSFRQQCFLRAHSAKTALRVSGLKFEIQN